MKKPYFIAEIGSNHNGDPDRIRALIVEAKHAGFDAVKFQLFTAETLYHPSCGKEKEVVKSRELNPLLVYTIDVLCREHSIDFICTPFSLEAVDLIQPFVKGIKISSFDLLRLDLIAKAARTKLPLYISTGMAEEKEILDALVIARSNGAGNITLFHCNSNYPAQPENCHLKMIYELRDIVQIQNLNFNTKKVERIRLGWSDHTVDVLTILTSILYARVGVVEMHFDLRDRCGAEYSHGHCWTPAKSLWTIERVKEAIKIMGDKDVYNLQLENDPNRDWRADPKDGLRPMRSVRS